MQVTVNCSPAQLHDASSTEFVSQSAKFVICLVCKPIPLHQGAYRSSKTHKEYQSMSSENRSSYQTYHNDCPKKSLAAIADLTECCSHLWII